MILTAPVVINGKIISKVGLVNRANIKKLSTNQILEMLKPHVWEDKEITVSEEMKLLLNERIKRRW